MTTGLSRIATILLIAFAGLPIVCAQARADDVALADDLRAVIVLAGYPCAKVNDVTRADTNGYHVSCVPDRQYRVSISEEKEVLVESLSDPARAPAPTDESHDEFMKRKLFSIVNLAGHRCAGVLAYEHRGPRDSLVTCEDQTVYRIHVTPEGRVAVDEHMPDK